jgi:hypothetical protein
MTVLQRSFGLLVETVSGRNPRLVEGSIRALGHTFGDRDYLAEVGASIRDIGKWPGSEFIVKGVAKDLCHGSSPEVKCPD